MARHYETKTGEERTTPPGEETTSPSRGGAHEYDSPVHDYLAPTRAVLGVLLAASPLFLTMPAMAATILVIAGLLIFAVSGYNTWKTRAGNTPGRGACVTSLLAGIVVAGTPLYVDMGLIATWFSVLLAAAVISLSGIDLTGTTGKRRITRVHHR